MKKIIILGLATAVITLTSLTASAESDDQYPAANFQPKVIYSDAGSAKPASKCPTNKPAVKEKEKEAEFDPNYPAAHFAPKVIYP